MTNVASLGSQKVPRSIDFEAELPRLPTGKLYKRLLRDRSAWELAHRYEPSAKPLPAKGLQHPAGALQASHA